MINLVAGLWLFVSPWVYRAHSAPNAWNSWIVGALIVSFAATRISNPFHSRGASVINVVLGAWTFASPWIYRYTGDTHRFFNSLCVGIVVFILGVVGQSMGRTVSAPPRHP